MDQELVLKKIKEIVLDILPGSKIFLFGSRARDTNKSKSDYDILIVTKKNYDIREKITFSSLVNKALAQFGIPSDILLNSEDEIEIKKELRGHIIRSIVRDAIAL